MEKVENDMMYMYTPQFNIFVEYLITYRCPMLKDSNGKQSTWISSIKITI